MTTAVAARRPRAPSKAPVRRKAAAPKKKADLKKELGLPDSAVLTESAGRSFLLVPTDEFLEWLEDQMDLAEIQRIKDSGEPFLPMEEVHRRLGIKI